MRRFRDKSNFIELDLYQVVAIILSHYHDGGSRLITAMLLKKDLNDILEEFGYEEI